MKQIIYEKSQVLGQTLLESGLQLVTAESCTGGLIGAAITDVPGSSRWYHRGFITYSNEAKEDMLGLERDTLCTYGAVSREVVLAMLHGALLKSGANLGVAVSGIAGPDGGTEDKPVGTVWIAWGDSQRSNAEKYLFTGDRQQVREAAVLQSLGHLSDHLATKI